MNETEKINYTLLERARTMIFAAHGAPVEMLTSNKGWQRIPHSKWNWQHWNYRISPDWLNVPEGYELVPMGESVPTKTPYRGCWNLWANDEGHNWVSYSGSDNINPHVFVARPIELEPEPRKVDLTKEDWDGHPVWWIRKTNRVLEPGCAESMVTEIYPSGTIRKADGIRLNSDRLSKHYERSHNRREWTLCYKMQELS